MKTIKRIGLLCALFSPLAGSPAPAATPPHRVYGDWNSSEIGGGGYLQQVHFCPTDANRLYMTSDVGGLFRSDDLGKTWRMLHGTLPAGGGTYEVRGLLVNPADADHVIIACGSPWGANKGIFITRDGGKTWTQTLKAMFPGNGDSRGGGKIIAASPADPKLLVAAADEGVYRSENFGDTWTPVSGPTDMPSPNAVIFDESHPDRVWLCLRSGSDAKSGLFISEDAGKTFHKIADKSPSEFVQDPADSNIIHGLLDERPHRSTDLGKTWTPTDKVLPKRAGAREDGTYSAIAAGHGMVILGGHGGNFYLLDRKNDTWTNIPRERVDEGQSWWGRMRPGMYNHFGSALGDVSIDPKDAKHWYFTDWYACYETVDAGTSWTLRIDGVEMTVIHTVVPDLADPKLIHVGMADLGYFRSADAGEIFSWNNTGISNNIKSIATTPADPKRMYAVGPKEWHWYANQVFISSDGGQSWKRPAMRGLPNMDEARCNTIVASPRNADEVYLTISGEVKPGEGGIYRSKDAGNNWEWISEGMPGGGMFRKDIWVHGPEVAASADGGLVAISCDRNKLMRYDGTVWKEIAPPSKSGGTNGVFADPSTAGRYYLAMKEGGLLRSDDGGKSWSQLTGKQTFWAAVDPKNPQHLATTTHNGVLASIDGGTTWIEMDSALPYKHPRNVVAVSGGRVYVGTGGNGVFWAPLPKSGPAAGPTNLISNGEMTQGGGQPASWEMSGYKVGEYSMSRDATMSKSAPASLQVQTEGKATGFVHQKIEAAKGSTVTLRGFARVKGSFQRAQIAAQLFDGSWKQTDWKSIAEISADDGWKEFQGSFTVPDVSPNILIGISFEGTGQIWLDDVMGYVGSEAPAAQAVAAGQTPSPTPAVVSGRAFDVPAAAPLPLRIPADHAMVRYVGRFDLKNPQMPRASWAGSLVTVRFRGTDVNAVIDGGNNNRFQVIVDGVASKVIAAPSRQTVRLATGLSDEPHTVSMMKITEPIFGNAGFGGFELNAGAEVLPTQTRERSIEIIGDSISAGYGNEAASEKEKFSHTTENAYLTYGSLAAKKLGADVQIIAWSGKCMAPKNTLPEMYKKVLPQEGDSPEADLSSWTPQVIVINLGTNDFAGGNPDEESWISAYREFIRELRRSRPDATIFCAVGPMLSDPWSPSKNALSTCTRYLTRIVSESNGDGDKKVYFLEFPMQDGRDGMGADWHPSRKTHQLMADQLLGAIEQRVGWQRK